MTLPVGVYDFVISNKAFKVTVKGACWKQESREISETDALHDDAQLLFFPLWQLICEQHGEGMDPAIIRRRCFPGLVQATALQENGLQLLLSSVLSHQQAAPCTEPYKLV